MMGHGGLAGVIVERRWSWATAQAKWEHHTWSEYGKAGHGLRAEYFGCLAFVG
jgi:hypothetical protein